MRSMAPIELEEFETQPFRFTASRRLDADPQAIFTELADPSLWFPMMTRSRWHTGATSGVGAQREVHLRAFGEFRERMLAWDSGERVAFTMIATSSPLVARMAEAWRISHAPEGTRVDWDVVATPTTAGRAVTPGLRVILRAMFAQASRSLGRRAGSYPARKW